MAYGPGVPVPAKRRAQSAMLSYVLVLAAATRQPLFGSFPTSAGSGLALYADSVRAEIVKLIDAFANDAKLDALVQDLSTGTRVLGNEPSTPLAAAFAWADPQGVKQCDMTYSQKVAMNNVLGELLSPGGYQTLNTVVNSQRIIGELEEWASGNVSLVSRMWQEMVARNMSVESQTTASSSASFFELADSLGIGFEDVKYLPIAGVRPDDRSVPLEQYGNLRFLLNHSINWDWAGGGGFVKRLEQFCDFSMAIYVSTPPELQAGTSFAVRFEGHHISVNVLVKYTEDGDVTVNMTPLMVGAFPMVSLPVYSSAIGKACESPQAWGDWIWQAQWTEGQSINKQIVDDSRTFFGSLPDATLAASHVSAEHYLTKAPFDEQVQNEYQFFAGFNAELTPDNLERALEGLPYTIIHVGELTPKSTRSLKSMYHSFFNMMDFEVAAVYQKRLDTALANPHEHILLVWAGTHPLESGQPFGMVVETGHLLLELSLSPEWSTSTREPTNESNVVPLSNHVHSIMRDLDFNWMGDPLMEHNEEHH